MPQLMKYLLEKTDDISASWRMCFILPLVMHFAAALFIATGRDLPDGSYKDLEVSGAKQKSKGGGSVAKIGFSNTNAWIMLVTYGLCFGVELTMNNKLVAYFERYYAIANETAGPLGATFSLMNLFARSWGGILSDVVAKKYGMRGRITAMWVVQTLEGLMCIFLGLVTVGYDSPDEMKYRGLPKVNSTWETTYGTTFTFDQPKLQVNICGSKLNRSPTHGWVNNVLTPMPIDANTLIIMKDPADNCIHAQDTLWLTILMIICFSICVQMAEGLHFGIVPYISRPALGVVSGMVGAGGNAGALIAGQFIIGAGKKGNLGPLDDGFIRLGGIIMGVSMIMHFIYFPKEGGILTPPGLGFDPQIIKPDADQKGADELNFDKAKTTSTNQSV